MRCPYCNADNVGYVNSMAEMVLDNINGSGPYGELKSEIFLCWCGTCKRVFGITKEEAEEE